MKDYAYQKRTYLLMTVDPLHIGSGGYRLGRVDNAIVREPGTNLPKIPGTSLSGAIRQYAAYRLGKPECAGQGGGSAENENGNTADKRKSKHCGTCPVCYTFGYVKGQNDPKSYAGTVNLFDARILFFPVYSIRGPVWVTTRELLEECNFKSLTDAITDTEVVISFPHQGTSLNLGWLLLNIKQSPEAKNLQIHISLPDSWKDPEKVKELNAILGKTVLVSDKLFAHIVNSNLEVRTSVSIDPFTGAAESGALFTYEALPRATFLTFDVVEDDYRGKEEFKNYCEKFKEREMVKLWKRPLDVVYAGLDLAEALGIGGMGTRGFGRIRKITHHDTPADRDLQEVV
jgi:CRISPR-associated protein Cmr4